MFVQGYACKGMHVSVQVGVCVCIECYGEVVHNRS